MEKILNLTVTTKTNDVDEQGRVTVAVNRTGIEDSQGDISMPGSFDETLKNDIHRMKWLYNHDVTQLLGVPLEGREKDGDIIMVGQLNMHKQMCKDVYTDYKLMAEYGRTLEHSVGVRALDRDKNDRRKVYKWQMFEYSTLSFLGANPCTYLVDIKSATPTQVKDAVTLLEAALRQPEYSDHKLKDLDMNLKLLLKKLNGGRIVKCPHCGHVFDYDEQPEHSYTEQVLDCARDYTRWITDGAVARQMSELEPQIQNEVAAIIDTVKSLGLPMEAKSITDLLAYVRCPECWNRVYSDNTTTEAPVEEPAANGGKPEETTKGFGSFLANLNKKY